MSTADKIMHAVFIVISAVSLLVTAWFLLFFFLTQKGRNQLFHPGYGACGYCERTWDVAQGHITTYKDAVYKTGNGGTTTVLNGAGCFPLCKECWEKLGIPEARLPYYRKMFEEWGKDVDPADWDKIKAAVMKGL